MRQTALAGMTVAFFGHAPLDYSRNRMMHDLLAASGARVVDLLSSASRAHERWPDLRRKALEVGRIDAIWLGWPSQTDVATARLVGHRHRAPVILDAFNGVYETLVVDRERIARGSAKAAYARLLDVVGCRLADALICDTDVHGDYLAKATGVRRDKFTRIWVGSQAGPPRVSPASESTHVVFYGSYVPLQGAPVVVEAASRLAHRSDIRFTMIGEGQDYKVTVERARELGCLNVEFLPTLDYGELRRLLSAADVSLGIFADRPKTRRVIPNKVVDAISLGVPVVTSDTPAVREALVPSRDFVPVPAADAGALADAVVGLADDPATRALIGKNGQKAHARLFSPTALQPLVADAVLQAVQRLR